MRYKKLTGVILKKQNYKEADQILTLWTKEMGKIRILAKSLRLPKSKLAYAVTDLSLVEVDTVGSELPVLVAARPIRQFKNLQSNLHKMVIGFYAAELMLKMTADDHPNAKAFDLLSDFLKNLQQADYSLADYELLDSFSLKLLDSLGFKFPDDNKPTHSKIRQFIEYILERNLKSETLLTQI